MKPVKFTKITKKYINDKIKNIRMAQEEKKLLYQITIDTIKEKRLFLKDMRAITYFAGKNHLEIAFYSIDRYFTKEIEIWR